MIFKLGLKSKLFRKLYYKLTGKWHWGLYRLFEMKHLRCHKFKTTPPDPNLDSFLELVFHINEKTEVK